MDQHVEGSGSNGEGGGEGVVLAFQMNSPRFVYIVCLKVFAEREISFTLTFLQMLNFLKYKVIDDFFPNPPNDITSAALMQRLCHS